METLVRPFKIYAPRGIQCKWYHPFWCEEIHCGAAIRALTEVPRSKTFVTLQWLAQKLGLLKTFCEVSDYIPVILNSGLKHFSAVVSLCKQTSYGLISHLPDSSTVAYRREF